MPDTPFSSDDIAPGADDFDEAISALLDDELDGWATERGLDPTIARRSLEARPDFPTRRAALSAARDALRAAPQEPLDELTRRRLVHDAVQALPATASLLHRKPIGRWVPVAAAVSACVLVAGGLALALRDGRDDTSASRESAATSAGSAATSAFAGDLGDVTDPAELRARVERDPRIAAFEESSPAASKSRGVEATTTLAPPPTTVVPSPAARDALPGVPEPVRRCVEQLVGRKPSTARVILVATASYQQQPVVVVVTLSDDRTTTSVLARSTCETVAAQSSELP